ncbi:hypothetical protein MHYP_G00147110 [Metynnis hypsauchen]
MRHQTTSSACSVGSFFLSPLLRLFTRSKVFQGSHFHTSAHGNAIRCERAERSCGSFGLDPAELGAHVCGSRDSPVNAAFVLFLLPGNLLYWTHFQRGNFKENAAQVQSHLPEPFEAGRARRRQREALMRDHSTHSPLQSHSSQVLRK